MQAVDMRPAVHDSSVTSSWLKYRGACAFISAKLRLRTIVGQALAGGSISRKRAIRLIPPSLGMCGCLSARISSKLTVS